MPTVIFERKGPAMPMIDVTARTGTFTPAQQERLIADLTAAVLRWEKAPDTDQFRANTAGFVHELPPAAIATAAGGHDVVRVEVLTPPGVLDQDQRAGIVAELTTIVATVAGDTGQAARTWVLLRESADGGWGIAGRAFSVADLRAAR